MNCDRAEKAEKASHPGNLPTSLLLISRMKKKLEEKTRFFGVFLNVLVQFLVSNPYLFIYHGYFAKKLVKNVHSCLK